MSSVLTPQNIIVIGSIAYDHVMRYGGRFRDAVMPDNYNIALSTRDRQVFFGGCGGNIAYSLRLLGERPVIMTVAGRDFDAYRARLEDYGIDPSHIHQTEKFMTASAFIVTDEEENQITLFDPGAMHGVDTNQSLKDVGVDTISWVMIAPDKPATMTKFAREAKGLGLPYVFDPGQQLSIFDPDDLLQVLRDADVFIVNEYESKLLASMLDLPREEIAALPRTYIETHGASGCRIIEHGKAERAVKAVPPERLVDPTGCGDAFRAGVTAGLRRGLPLEICCQMGALLATYSLEHLGTQRHMFTPEEFARRLDKSFGHSPA